MVHIKKCPHGKRGNPSTEFYKDGKPQIYCMGWIDSECDELLPICRNCADHVDKAQEDIRRREQ